MTAIALVLLVLGLLFATLATLFFVPVVFGIVHGSREEDESPAASE